MDALRELIDFALEFPEDADVGSKGETNRLGEKADKELAQLQAIATAAREVVNDLKENAQKADKFHDLQEQKYEKWLKNKRGQKPGSAVALPIAANVMRSAASKLAAALAALEQETK